MSDGGEELVATFGALKFIRITVTYWHSVQCEKPGDTYGIARGTGGYMMFKLMKCGHLVPIRFMDGDETEALEVLDPKVR